jgi:FKBP-type peptidyl-prolyl cis-trans isomerase SlyD
MLEVADGLMVSIDYTLRLDNDDIIDSSEGRPPLQYVQGQNQIVPGLENALYGMAIGEKKHVVVEPTEGYGERNPEANQVVPRDAFQGDVELKAGMPIRVSDGSGRTATAVVADVSPETVKLDFNHPLAGETLYFEVEIAGLREPTAADMMGSCGPCGGCSGPSEGCC